MHARIRHVGEVTIFDLNGNIDFETAKPFRDQCVQILHQSKHAPHIAFNLRGLKFVGSSGLSSFIQTLKEFNKLQVKPRFFGVGTEFKKMFRIYSPEESFEIFMSEDEAVGSFLEV